MPSHFSGMHAGYRAAPPRLPPRPIATTSVTSGVLSCAPARRRAPRSAAVRSRAARAARVRTCTAAQLGRARRPWSARMPPSVNTCPPGTSARHAVEQRLALVGLRVHDELERRFAEVVIAPVGDDALKLRAAGRGALSGPFERQWQPGRLSMRVRPRRERAAPRRGVGTSPPARGGDITVATFLPPRMEPRTWARLQRVVMAVIGSVWLVGSIASLILGEAPR